MSSRAGDPRPERLRAWLEGRFDLIVSPLLLALAEELPVLTVRDFLVTVGAS